MLTSEVRIGVVTSGDSAEAVALEARSLDSLWVGGHIASRNPSPETIVGLVRLATATERVAIGTAVLPLPLYPPALIAKQVADLDRVSGGRLLLGVGVGGEYPQEFQAVRVPIEERGRRADEAIPLLRRLWTGAPVSHSGPLYPMDDVRIHPAPAQLGGPPILVAGRTPPAMRRAARLGDGWFPYLYSPRRYAESVTRIRSEAGAVGRNLDGFHWCVWIFVNVNPDADRARDETARTLGGNYRQDFGSMLDHVAVAGSAADVTASLLRFHDAGARHFVFMPATAGEPSAPMLDRLFGDVLPVLRARNRP